MSPARRAVLEQPLREAWAPVVGINVYDVPDAEWERHQQLVRELGPSPAAWPRRGRIHLLAAWRGDGVRHVVWVNWFPEAAAFLGGEATHDEQAALDEWLSLIRGRTWHVAQDFTAEVAPTSENQNRACVERHVQAVNAADAHAFVDCMTDDVRIHWPRSGREINGKTAVAEWIGAIFNAFDHLSNEIVDVCASGQTVVLEIIARGTQVRELEGTAAGRVLDTSELFVYRFRDGKICEARCY
jgi:steroid delta-isomerase-like uncharacterized protein